MLGRYLAFGGFRNSQLENYHAEGRISEQEMRELMLEVEDSISNLILDMIHKGVIKYGSSDNSKEYFDAFRQGFFSETGISWDNPQLDKQKGGI